jgi:hypothetical protein
MQEQIRGRGRGRQRGRGRGRGGRGNHSEFSSARSTLHEDEPELEHTTSSQLVRQSSAPVVRHVAPVPSRTTQSQQKANSVSASDAGTSATERLVLLF